MHTRGRPWLVRQLALVALGCGGCNVLLGLEDGLLVEDRCEPFSAVACYSGPRATEGVGACQTGLRRCNAAGDGYGPCEGDITPAPERCGNAADDDCDGAVDETEPGLRDSANGGAGVCACNPGEVEVCPYGGPPGTAGIGACRAGQRTCGGDGRWGECAGEVTPRAEDCATPADEDCSGGGDCGAALAGGILGGPGRERARALAAADGSFVTLGGEFEGSLDLGAASLPTGAEQDLFVARIGSDLTASWVRRLVKAGRGWLHALAVNPEGVVAVTGKLEGAMIGAELITEAPTGFVVKLDKQGEVLWAALLRGEPRDVALSVTGEVVVASAVEEPGGGDVEVASYGAGGLLLWSRELRGAGQQAPTGVAADARGHLYVTGTFEQTLELGEDAPRLTSAGLSDVFLVELDRRGAHVASRAFGDGREQRGGDIEAGPGGEVALSGTFEGLLDLGESTLFADVPAAFVVELGAAGEHHFSRAFRADVPPHLALEADGGLVFAGDVAGPTDLGGGPLDSAGLGSDIVVARLDAGGRHLWSKRLGPGPGRSDGNRSAAGVAAFADSGHVLLAGTVEGSVDLDGESEQSITSDVLLVRLAP